MQMMAIRRAIWDDDMVIVMLSSALAIYQKPPTPLDWWDAGTFFHCHQHGAREARNTHGSPSAMSAR